MKIPDGDETGRVFCRRVTQGVDMSRKLLCTIAVGSVLLVAGPMVPARAANPEFCRDYARAGVSQAREALSYRRCAFRIENESRWSTDYRVHYDWCRGVSREQADRERGARSHMLERCVH